MFDEHKKKNNHKFKFILYLFLKFNYFLVLKTDFITLILFDEKMFASRNFIICNIYLLYLIFLNICILFY